jgi:hypothetical protein
MTRIPADDFQQQLTDFLRFFGSQLRGIDQGRKLFAHHGVVYWPDFAAAMRRSTVWRDRYCPPRLLEEDRRQRGVPPSGRAYQAWFLKALRRHVEMLLTPLLIPTDSTVGGNYVSYALERRGMGDDRIDDVNPEVWADLNSRDYYTYFKRVNASDTNMRRILALPPDFSEFKVQMAAVPQEIVALYYAWRTITERAKHPYDPREIGIEWTTKGMLFINWARFFNSPLKPPVTVSPSECAAFLRGGHTKGKYRLKLSAFPDPHRFDSIPQETEAIDDDDFRAMAEPCSLVDTLYLARRESLFSALYHTKRSKKQRASRERNAERIKERRLHKKMTGNEAPLKRQRRMAKVHTFCFRPIEHVQREFTTFERPFWLATPLGEADYEENVYAISFKGQLYFAQPAIPPKDMPECERSATKRAMDRLSCVAQFAATGDVTQIVNKSKTQQMRELQEAEWLRTAPHIIENFLSLDALTQQQLRKVKRETNRRIGEDTDNPYSGENWYQNTMLNLARRTLPVSAVRRTAYCIIPGRNDEEPKEHVFYSVQTLKQFQEESKGNVIPISPNIPLPPGVDAAPYIYAWATFCINAHRSGASYAIKDPGRNSHWTPPEDQLLVRHYRRFPRLKNEEKAALLRLLPNHSWKGITQRVRQINTMLKELLTHPRMQRCEVGRAWLNGADPDIEAVRLSLLIGIGMNRRYQGEPLHVKLESVGDVFKLDEDTLKALVLPNTYRSDQFELLARG